MKSDHDREPTARKRDAAPKVLRQRKRPMRLAEIVRAIEQRGLCVTQSPISFATVATALRRDE